MSKKHDKKHHENKPIVEAGDWKNFLEPPITLREILTKVTISKNADSFTVTQLNGYQLNCTVLVK